MANDAELDLVEVSPDAKPPVCKIISWSKFKYDLSKKKRSSSKGKSKEMKEMWFSPYIGKGDIDHKLKKVREFLKDKHPVKMTIRVKGRVHDEVVYDQLGKILKLIKGEYITESNPRREGRNLSIIILPPKSTKKKESDKSTSKTKKSTKNGEKSTKSTQKTSKSSKK
jgi:translation initiation factor IF-3